MSEFNLPGELWLLENVVTGFSVVQSVTFALALGGPLADLLKAPNNGKLAIAGVTLFFGIIYSAAVLGCCALAVGLPDFPNKGIWWDVSWGRVAGIWLFSFLAIGALYSHVIDARFFPEQPPPKS